MKPVKASATPSTSDAVSRRRHIRSLDELTMSFRPLEPMSYNLIESTQDSSVKGHCACPRPAASFAAHAPHASGCQECKFANYPVFSSNRSGYGRAGGVWIAQARQMWRFRHGRCHAAPAQAGSEGRPPEGGGGREEDRGLVDQPGRTF